MAIDFVSAYKDLCKRLESDFELSGCPTDVVERWGNALENWPTGTSDQDIQEIERRLEDLADFIYGTDVIRLQPQINLGTLRNKPQAPKTAQEERRSCCHELNGKLGTNRASQNLKKFLRSHPVKDPVS